MFFKHYFFKSFFACLLMLAFAFANVEGNSLVSKDKKKSDITQEIHLKYSALEFSLSRLFDS